jgi:pyruvate-ferredoxin/flavodoxin oxidoreductase
LIICGRRAAKVGSIHVNVIRPFPEAAIVEALKGKKNVIILERTDEALSGDNPLGRDIRTALSKAVQYEGHPSAHDLPAISPSELPNILSGSYGLGSRDFRPEHIIGAYEYATAGRARKDGKTFADGANFIVLGIDHPYSVVGDEMPSLLPEGAVAVRFHSIGGWGAITTGKNLGAILGDLNDLLFERDGLVDDLGNPKEVIHVSANPKYGSEKKGAPTSYFMVAAKDRIRVNCDLRHVTVVLCCDPKAFTHTNPLDGMQEGGSLVWESEEEGERAWQNLPIWARKQIIEKKIRVFTLPGFEIARKATDRADLQLRMQGNAFLGAFFAVSPMLQEFGITQEQFATSSQAVREEVRQAGRRRCAVEHGSHAAGLRAREGDQDRRVAAPTTPACAARRCCRFGDGAVPGAERLHRWRRLPFARDSRGPGPAHADQHDRHVRRGVPLALRLQPAGHAALGHGRDCRATGDTASKYVARRETPLYIPENCTQCMECISVCPDTALPNCSQDLGTLLTHGGFALRGRSRRARKMLQACRRSRSSRAAHGCAEIKQGTPLPKIFAKSPSQVDGFSAEAKAQFFDIIDKVPMAYQKVNAIFSSPERKAPGSGGIFSIFVSDLCKGCAACVTACGDHRRSRWCRRPKRSTPST